MVESLGQGFGVSGLDPGTTRHGSDAHRCAVAEELAGWVSRDRRLHAASTGPSVRNLQPKLQPKRR